MRDTVRRWATSRITLSLLALLAVYAAAGFLLLPYLAERYLVRYVEDTLQRRIAIDELRVNPFTFEIEARNVALKEADGRPVAAFGRLFADFDLSSLMHRAWTFGAVAVEDADVSLTIDRDGRFNLADLAQRFPRSAEPRPEPSSPPAVIVQNLSLSRGTLRYTDQSAAQPVSAVIQPIDLTMTGLATLPGQEGRYRLTATLPERAALEWQGGLTLQPLASTGELRLAQFKLATAWPFLRDRLRLAEPGGGLDLQARYRFDSRDAGPQIVIDGVDARITDLALALAGSDSPLLALKSVHARQGRYDSASGAVTVPELALADGRFVAALDAEGVFNWSRLALESKDTKQAPARWSARLAAVKLQNIAVRYEDHTRVAPLAVDIGKGDASLKLALDSGAAVRTIAEDMRLTLTDVALAQAGAAEPLAALASAAISGRIDTGDRVIAVREAVLSGGNAVLMRDAQGGLALTRAFARAKPAPPEEASSPPWSFRIDAARLDDAKIAIGDAGYEPALRYDVEVATLALRNFDAASEAPLAFQADAKIAQGGGIRASGEAAQDFGAVNARLELTAASIPPLQPLLAKHTTLELRSGTLSGAATVEYGRDRKPRLRVAGGLKVNDVAVNETRSKQRFATWKTLALDGIDLTLTPDRLEIKEMLLEQPETAIVISQKQTVNLTQIMKDAPQQAPGAEEAQPAAGAQPAAAPAEPAFPMRVARLRVQNGTLDFADYSLVLPFSTRVTRLGGSVLGISNAPDGRAELKLAGRIEPVGYASAEGGLNLRRPTAFMDINVKFQNVEMPPLSPYTATFAGRKIAGGRLWLDLDYKIVDQQLAGNNKILLENVELGERVEAPNALNLPLDLAIALLKDSQGRINMAIPVRGDVGKPEFAYGQLVMSAIGSALTRIVTAPFRALAALFGGTSAEELSEVRFSPGSSRLFPPQREQLEKVAKALQDRPQLKVVIHGAYDPRRDADRLRLQPVRRELAAAMGMALQPGEDPGPVPYSDPDTQQAIEKLFVARAGRDALDAYAAQQAKARGKALSALGPDERRAYYEGLFEQLVAAYPLADAAVQQLAGARAQAIAAFLAESGVDRGRIELGSLREVNDASEPTVDAQLALAVDDKRS